MSSAIDTASLIGNINAVSKGYAKKQEPNPDSIARAPWTRRDVSDMLYIRSNLEWVLAEIKSGHDITEQIHGWAIRNVISLGVALDRKEQEFLAKAGFSPGQPRVPAGSSNGGQWTDSGGGAGSGRVALPHRKLPNLGKPHPHADSPYYDPETGIYDPPIEPVYPVETLIATVYGRRAFRLAMSVIRRKPPQSQTYNRERQTDHGHQRVGDRTITDKDIDTAIETAKKTGNITVKKGPYNTPQYHYHGENGLTVIVETEGRNAGKIITMYGKKPGGKL